MMPLQSKLEQPGKQKGKNKIEFSFALRAIQVLLYIAKLWPKWHRPHVALQGSEQITIHAR